MSSIPSTETFLDEETQYPYPEREIRFLSHPVKSARIRAYKSVDAILSQSTKDGYVIDTFPLYLIASGDILAGMGYLTSEAATIGNFQNIGVATEAFFKILREYERVQKVLQAGTHPEFRDVDRRLCSAIKRELPAFIEVFQAPPVSERLMSYYLEKVRSDAKGAYDLLKTIVEKYPRKTNPEDYVRLGDLVKELGGEVAMSADWYHQGLEKFTTDPALFERYEKCLLMVYGEEKAKEFYRQYGWKTQYKLPFAAIRGGIADTEDTTALTATVDGFHNGQKIEDGTLEYFRAVHDQVSSNYESKKEKAGTLPEITLSADRTAGEYFHSVGGRLLLLEHLIFRLYDFRYTLEYMALIDSVRSKVGGRDFLSSYFLENPLVLTEPEDAREPTGTEGEDLNSEATIESEVERRYAYISENFFYQTPGTLSAKDVQAALTSEPNSDIMPTFSASVHNILSDQMLALAGNEKAAVQSSELAHMLQKEASVLLLAGNLGGWHDTFIERIIEKYGTPVLHTLAYHARNDSYIGKSLPPVCNADTELTYFFVVERIIANGFDIFGGTLPLIARKYRLYDIPYSESLKLGKLLCSRGYYKEAFDFLGHHPSTIFFTEGIYLLTECLKYIASTDTDMAEKLLKELDEVVRANSNCQTFIERVEECFDGVGEDISTAQAQYAQGAVGFSRKKTMAPPPKQISDRQAEHGKLAYCLAFFYVNTREVARQFLDVASQRMSPDACLLEIELERETENWDPEDAIFRLEQQLLVGEKGLPFPLRKDYIIALIELSNEMNDSHRRERYLQMARMYGIDVFRYEFLLLLETPEQRRYLYEFLLRKDFSIFFQGKEDLLGELQKYLNSDIVSPEISLELRLLAGFIKKGISSDRDLGYIPVTLEYWGRLYENLSDSTFNAKYTELIERGFAITVAGESPPLRCLRSLQYLLEKDDTYFHEFMKEAQRIPDVDIRPYNEMYKQFLESATNILGAYRESTFEVSRFTDNSGENAASLYAYWKGKLESIGSASHTPARANVHLHSGTNSLQ